MLVVDSLLKTTHPRLGPSQTDLGGVLDRHACSVTRSCPPSSLMRQIGRVEEGRISGSS